MRPYFILALVLLVVLMMIAIIATIALPIAQVAVVIFAWAIVLADFGLLIYISLH